MYNSIRGNFARLAPKIQKSSPSIHVNLCKFRLLLQTMYNIHGYHTHTNLFFNSSFTHMHKEMGDLRE